MTFKTRFNNLIQEQKSFQNRKQLIDAWVVSERKKIYDSQLIKKKKYKISFKNIPSFLMTTSTLFAFKKRLNFILLTLYLIVIILYCLI